MTYRNVFVDVRNSASNPDLKIITISGSLDAVTVKGVDQRVLPLIEQGTWNIIMNLSDLRYLSSTGMMCLIKYLIYTNDRQKIFKMVKPPQAVYDTLKVAGIARHFEIYESVANAVDSFK
jgi:anti-anti-sigma factor